ncbi:protein translocase subunit SecF [Thermosynechococcaceae cyanobacterium BACA0444]|uniref:Protein-export membrane protein SecF n=1 Tax=Pseudocalidococcus azoricus BACA0444 TaxID=2918990 RepID=A0AAE4FRE2_9CYAN|nr:protein translocase subunit SecF [Pseudocalidococcus azoricus]MDS3860765.1 protein translocase subunit SecF [Pseudocalidococcus azoricus BACA0444]
MSWSVTKNRYLWWGVSVVTIVAGLVAMVISWTNPQIQAPLKLGLDFVGGTRLQVVLDCAQAGACDQPVDLADVRAILSEQGLGNSSLQVVDQTGISIRTQPLDVDQRTKLVSQLAQGLGKFDPKQTQIETVGPTLGRQLLNSGLLALLVSFVGITVYLTLRFQFDYAFFALVALVHDVLVTIGIFAILGITLGVEVDSLFVVALLTIIGFSVNDTVVIYDRIRENLKIHPENSIDDVVDDSVNQTLTRSINTTLTTTLPLIAIVFFGGETLRFFALALIIGFVSGAYSSIFCASTLLGWWRQREA